MPRFPTASFELPGWVDDVCGHAGDVYQDVDAMVRLAIELSRRNVEHSTGGPFGAAIFDLDSGRLIAPGVNLVVPSNSAVAHAEIVAIAVSGQVTGDYDLGSGGHRTVLVASTEPCAMCFGSLPWSGVTMLVCAARDEDARAVGFDEGPKLDNWDSELESRGIEVVRDVERRAAADVLREYAGAGGLIYNSRAET